MPKRSAAGFSLIELLVVVSIIMVLSAIAIPRLTSARRRAYEATAVGTLHTLHTAQETYKLGNQEYADRFALLTEFAGAATRRPPRGGGGGGGRGRGRRGGGGGGGAGADVIVLSNYIFRLSRPSPDQWDCSVEPVRDRGTSKYFYTDQSGAIRYQMGDFATPSSPVL